MANSKKILIYLGFIVFGILGLGYAQTPTQTPSTTPYQTTWPFFKNDVLRSSVQSFDGLSNYAYPLNLNWQTTALGAANAVAYSSPVISFSNVYIGALDGIIYAL